MENLNFEIINKIILIKIKDRKKTENSHASPDKYTEKIKRKKIGIFSERAGYGTNIYENARRNMAENTDTKNLKILEL